MARPAAGGGEAEGNGGQPRAARRVGENAMLSVGRDCESQPPVVILCGGRGTRLQEHARAIPKPLVEIGGMPIVWHVVQLYAAHGFRRFLLATGYRGELIERFVDACEWPASVAVRCVDTGLDTPTGGRIRLLADELAQEQMFCATYADGLADIDLRALLRFHGEHRALATVTVVRPQLQFGVVELDELDRVSGFREKPVSEHWINGGFFCFHARALDYLRRDSVLEREPLQALARDRQLRAYRHHGFWECMDTYKDAIALNDMWASGRAPWHPSRLQRSSRISSADESERARRASVAISAGEPREAASST